MANTTYTSIHTGAEIDDAITKVQNLQPLYTGGTAGQVLTKNSNTDGDIVWRDAAEGGVGLPEGGTEGQIIVKNSDTDGDVSWKDYISIPTGGAAGQVLVKDSAESGDMKWDDIVALPAGGSVGQVLAKKSATDGDAEWVTVSDTKVTQTVVNPTTATSYPILASTSTSTDDNTAVKNSNVRIYVQQGTANAIGIGRITLGNAIVSGTAGNAEGSIAFYSAGSGYNLLRATSNSAGNYTNYLPAKNGTLVNNNIAAATSKAYVMGVSATGSLSATVTANSGVYTQNSVLYGAAYNDYAEYRESNVLEAGRCVVETGNGDLILSEERLAPAPEIISDTFGFAIGETDICKTPIAVTGRVLAFPYEDRESYRAGDAVCAAPGGTVSKMTREEIKEYPDRIVGIVSEIPHYDTWGENNTKVNGRIWIRIR